MMTPSPPKRSVRSLILFSTLIFIALCSLGIWQISRLQQSQALVHNVNQRSQLPPLTLAEAQTLWESGKDIEFLPVQARGSFIQQQDKFFLESVPEGPAYRVITPLLTEDGIFVLVDRGLIPEARKAGFLTLHASETIEIHGFIRSHFGKKGLFVPQNNIANNIWYWWDMAALLSRSQPPAAARRAGFVLHQLNVLSPNDPIPSSRDIKSSNNHLAYAIIWFGLAFILTLMLGKYIFSQKPRA